ncbi:hypothetical protein [Sphingomonas bacterium]|uniref:hypothetical protein n=1 Tax=Sphingomonas bacterium TaxID=1895847 RepID=UPI001575DE15|nr:hypothetical protein [Sphingomonas bacterium]
MSDLVFLIPIAAITVGPLSWVANNWLRAKHGYPLEDYQSRRQRRDARRVTVQDHLADRVFGDGPGDPRKIELLTQENERLTGQIGRLEERLRVLERIATDPAERTAREIDALR